MDKIDNDISFCEDCFVAASDNLPAIGRILSRLSLKNDGSKNRDKAKECKFLLDIVANLDENISALRQRLEEIVRENPFQVWKVTKLQQGGATVICDDGNSKILYTQKIPYTDFPFNAFDLFASFDGENLVCMLKSEY
jgi:hypothetical protein